MNVNKCYSFSFFARTHVVFMHVHILGSDALVVNFYFYACGGPLALPALSSRTRDVHAHASHLTHATFGDAAPFCTIRYAIDPPISHHFFFVCFFLRTQQVDLKLSARGQKGRGGGKERDQGRRKTAPGAGGGGHSFSATNPYGQKAQGDKRQFTH